MLRSLAPYILRQRIFASGSTCWKDTPTGLLSLISIRTSFVVNFVVIPRAYIITPTLLAPTPKNMIAGLETRHKSINQSPAIQQVVHHASSRHADSRSWISLRCSLLGDSSRGLDPHNYYSFSYRYGTPTLVTSFVITQAFVKSLAVKRMYSAPSDTQAV